MTDERRRIRARRAARGVRPRRRRRRRARRVEEYLPPTRGPAEVEQHREVATMLAFTGRRHPGPVGPHRRLARRAPPRPRPASWPRCCRSTAGPPGRRRSWGANRCSVGRVAAAAAVIVAVLAVAVLDTDAAPIDAAVAAATRRPRPIVTDARARRRRAGRRGVIDRTATASSSPRTCPRSHRPDYQLWGVIDGQVISLGVLGTTPSRAVQRRDR